MPHRAHLFSLRIANALRESLQESPYTAQRFGKDIIAGITVGIIAIPLSMALAIASGVAPQYGLYTAMIAGFMIALTGGSRFSISGPTAAFVVILYPIAEKFGLGGLLLATLLSGLMLIAMAFARLGRFIEYIPESVTLGFTSGIAIVIATLQLKDFFGLTIQYPETYAGKIHALAQALPDFDGASLTVGLTTFTSLLLWKKSAVCRRISRRCWLVYSPPGCSVYRATTSTPSATVSVIYYRMDQPAQVFHQYCRNFSGPGSNPVPTVSRLVYPGHYCSYYCPPLFPLPCLARLNPCSARWYSTA